MPFYSVYLQQLTQWAPLNKIRLWLTPSRRRYLWHGITALSLILIIIGMAYTWNELPEDTLEFTPVYLGIAVGIYLVTYVMHLLGWHALATLTFGHMPLRVNVKAVASSDLVKYLPTIAWYIANRIHFYEQQQVKRGAVVAASLLEMVMMLGSGAIVYFALWLIRAQSWLISLIVISIIIIILVLLVPKFRQWWHERITAHHYPISHQGRYWIMAVFWYSMSWPVGGLFLVTILRAFTQVSVADYGALFYIWLGSALLGSVISISVGTLGMAREASLTFLLTRYWPLSASIATAVSVKIILTLGQIIFALTILGWFRLIERNNHE